MFYSERDIQEQRANEAAAEGFDPCDYTGIDTCKDMADPDFWMWTIGLECHHHANDTSKWVKTCEGIELDDTCWPACLYSAEAIMSTKEANRRGYVRQ